MISTRLMADTPFKDLTAFRDFSGLFWLYHRALLGQVFSVTGKTYAIRPIGDRPYFSSAECVPLGNLTLTTPVSLIEILSGWCWPSILSSHPGK